MASATRPLTRHATQRSKTAIRATASARVAQRRWQKDVTVGHSGLAKMRVPTGPRSQHQQLAANTRIVNLVTRRKYASGAASLSKGGIHPGATSSATDSARPSQNPRSVRDLRRRLPPPHLSTRLRLVESQHRTPRANRLHHRYRHHTSIPQQLSLAVSSAPCAHSACCCSCCDGRRSVTC